MLRRGLSLCGGRAALRGVLFLQPLALEAGGAAWQEREEHH